MSEIKVSGISGFVENVRVYDFDESIQASKFPMAVDTTKVTNKVTKMTHVLASCGMGEGHDNFLNGILVAFNLTFTNKAWTEAERYHFLDFVSSQSTMHCITKFDLEKQCDAHVKPEIIAVCQQLVDRYNAMLDDAEANDANALAEAYLDVLMNVPAGFKLTARMTTNYRQLKTIYYQRRHHRLPEWRMFCQWMIDNLPYFRELLEG